MSEQKIDNTFMRSMEQINNLEKVFREGGLLEKAVMDIKGDIAWLKDIREALSDAYEAMEDGHIGAVGHLNVPEESVDEDHYNGGRLGFSDLAKFGDEAAGKIDMEARRRGSADMEPGDADRLRYKVAKEMGYLKESKLTEGVLDSNDDDGFMARSQLYFMARDAIQLHSMIDDREDLEPWVQSKIAQAAQGIDAVRRYTEYNAMKEMPAEDPMDVGEGYDVLPSYDKERYQERDGLEGPFPTRSGKVLYYDPKEGSFYDPDRDMYITYDEWKALDEEFLPEALPFIAAIGGAAARFLPAIGRTVGSNLGKMLRRPKVNKPKTNGTPRKPNNTMRTARRIAGTTGNDSDTGFTDGYRTGSKITSSAEVEGNMIEAEQAKNLVKSIRNALEGKSPHKKGSAKYKKHMAAKHASMSESEERPYICVHAKKGKHECHAKSSYEAAKKAAEHWKMKSTSGIDAHLAKEETKEG